MKKLLAMMAVVGLVLPVVGGLAGCGTTMTMNPEDHERTVRRYMDLEWKQVVEDVDYALLQDEPSQLTVWYMPSKPR